MVKPNTTYTISSNATNGAWVVFIDNTQYGNVSVSTPITFTTPNSFNSVYVFFNNTNTNVAFMLNEGDHAYPYQPYNGEVVHKKELDNAVNGKQAQLYLHTISINGDGSYCGGKITLINRSATPINSFEIFKNSLTGIVNLSLVNEEDSGYYMLSYKEIQLQGNDVIFTNAICLDAATMTVAAHSILYNNSSTYTDVVETL